MVKIGMEPDGFALPILNGKMDIDPALFSSSIATWIRELQLALGLILRYERKSAQKWIIVTMSYVWQYSHATLSWN